MSVLACGVVACFSLSAQDRDVIAGIPVNYDETKVGDYKTNLPDPLVFNNGKPVTNAKQWAKRRKEILKLMQENQYGKWPSKKIPVSYSVKQDLGLNGTAVRKQITVDFAGHNKLDVLVYLPKDANGPVPVLLNLSFFGNSMAVSDEGILPGYTWDRESGKQVEIKPRAGFGGMMMRSSGMNATVKEYLEAGFGFATLCYTDIDPDALNSATYGVRGILLKNGATQPAADEWGSISAWAWGVSKVMDYFEKDPDIDAKRIALTGCSRLGKTTIWTGAIEDRIAVVMPSCSGEGGAAISRRNYGETIAHLVEPTRFPYQFCANYAKWGPDPTTSPVDANLLVALIAPRPLLLQTGSTDTWSDPKGEFISAVEAGKVYKLLGKDDLGVTEMPPADTPIYNTLGFVMHEGGHGVMPQDWKYYLEFMKRYL